MALLKDKYIYHTRKKKPGRVLKIALLVLLSALFITAIIFLFINIIKPPKKSNKDDAAIENLWNAKNYNEIIRLTDDLLIKNPLDSYLLAYKGFSCFYKADSEIEEKNLYYDRAINSLRKSLINKKALFQKEVYFILGICYFYKDKYYNDLAVKYIEKAISLGMESSDAYIRLGLAYGKLGNTQNELLYLLKALSDNAPDWLLLLIGKSYFKNKQYDKAEEYLLRYINRTDDPKTEQEARFKLGEIYLANEDYQKAEEQFKEILKLDDRSAEAHFNLGEIYFKFQDTVKARAEWRETLRIDPSHYGAKLRYYK